MTDFTSRGLTLLNEPAHESTSESKSEATAESKFEAVPEPRRYRLLRSHRLSGSVAFSAVFDARVRKSIGPIAVVAKPNDLPHCRLGLSIGRRVGNAVKRNRIKRLLREAYRLTQHDWPAGYDLVIVVRPHNMASLADYQRLLFTGIRGVHQTWERKRRKEEGAESERAQGSGDRGTKGTE